ncbi:hypothetical protein RHSP_82705 [Rhizobium freirei PRF 81]|uniref:Lipoprotein n=1 Tax=Rhizobium freirei PRF 81 TaxID=363754 RepID=N6VD29_9HYPH|nr:hypothetical protein [Rhizobium freirei]ENN88957.1 hypothetical protein RHSP_82705 [Rhizobium freirei PRF 81]
MRAMHSVRVGVSLAALVIGCGVMSGCLSSPTYGTDKTAGTQLLDDIGDMASISAATAKDKGVKYPNRPGLVVAGDKDNLAAPQQSLASKDNPAWLESPEDARKRLAEEADQKKNDVNYRSPLAQADSAKSQMTEAQQTAAYRAARQDQAGTYIDRRRYLIDPPQQYRQVSDPAALNDVGEPESKKEKKRKKDAEAAQQTNNSSWWKPFQ